MAKRLTPRAPSEARTRARQQRERKNKPAFAYGWHPERYEIRGGKIVPQLIRLHLQNGVNGVKDLGGGNWALGGLDDLMAKARVTRIPWDRTPDGQPYTAVDPDSGETYSRWETPYDGSDYVDFDEQGYIEWLTWLMQQGHVPPPADHVLTRMLHQAKDDLRKAKNRALRRPGDAPLVEAAGERVRIIEAALTERRKAKGKPRKTRPSAPSAG